VGSSYGADGFGLVLRVILLFIVFVVVRILVARSSGKAALANVVATGIVLSYIAGLVGQGLPRLEPDTVATGEAAVVEQGPHDTSDVCRSAPRVLLPGGAGSFDYLLDKDDRPLPVATPFTLDRNRSYRISGWAAESDGQHPALAVCAVVDGQLLRNASSIYGSDRPDIAAAFHVPSLASSGYVITIPPNALAAGNHQLAIAVESHEKRILLVARGFAVSVR
jgi:hypothetical protein